MCLVVETDDRLDKLPIHGVDERTDPAELFQDAHGREQASRPRVRTGFPHTLEKLVLKRLARRGPGLSLQRARELPELACVSSAGLLGETPERARLVRGRVVVGCGALELADGLHQSHRIGASQFCTELL